jgi:phage tail tape-measure protein
VCAALNGLITGASTIEGGISPLVKRWTRMQTILKSPDTTPEQLERALKSLATFLKSPGSLRLVSTHLGNKVQIAGRTFGSAVPKIAAVTRYAPFVGAAATAWSDWQGTHNAGEAATETVADVGAGLITAEVGAEGGAAAGALIGSVVPVAGTAIGAGIGAVIGGVAGIAASSWANSTIDSFWKREDW